MIILVKINRSYRPGTDPKMAASHPWTCGRMLDDKTYRDKFRFLAAMYDQRIIGVYCIKGLAQIIPSNPRKVWFALEDMNADCKSRLTAILQKLVDSGLPTIKRSISYTTLKRSELEIPDEMDQFEDCCPFGGIVLLEGVQGSQLEKQKLS